MAASANPHVHSASEIPEGWMLAPHYNDSYNVPKHHSRYGYVGVIAYNPNCEKTIERIFNHKLTFRNIKDQQMVVHHEGKYYFGHSSRPNNDTEGKRAFTYVVEKVLPRIQWIMKHNN